jgi:AcrR family transcriptional regulator
MPGRPAARLGTYVSGVETVEQILQAAVRLLVEQGYAALSLRKIADRCGMKVGNISYYFPTKDLLITALLETILKGYMEEADSIYVQDELDAEQKLARILIFWLEDIQTKWTTNLFPELWAMASHDPFVAERLDAFYRMGQDRFGRLIAIINPELPETERQVLCAYISGVMEGATLFAGFNKPWAAKMPWIAALSVRSILDLARTAKAEDIRSLATVWRYADDGGGELKPVASKETVGRRGSIIKRPGA